MRADAHYLLYADFNCPFCFAVAERIRAAGATEAVEWRGVQHRPRLPVPAPRLGSAERAELLEEHTRVAEIEPRLPLRNQGLRPNTAFATRIVAAVRRSSPGRDWDLVTALYRALWWEERDISEGGVVSAVLSSCGIPRPRHLLEAEADVRRWNEAWACGDFEGRLPAIRSDHGAKLLGLGTWQRFELFLSSGLFSSRNDDGTCAAA